MLDHLALLAEVVERRTPLPGSSSLEVATGSCSTLRRSAREAQKFGPDRRQSHGAAVQFSLAHLAQVAGFYDVTATVWELEAKIA